MKNLQISEYSMFMKSRKHGKIYACLKIFAFLITKVFVNCFVIYILVISQINTIFFTLFDVSVLVFRTIVEFKVHLLRLFLYYLTWGSFWAFANFGRMKCTFVFQMVMQNLYHFRALNAKDISITEYVTWGYKFISFSTLSKFLQSHTFLVDFHENYVWHSNFRYGNILTSYKLMINILSKDRISSPKFNSFVPDIVLYISQTIIDDQKFLWFNSCFICIYLSMKQSRATIL